MLPYLVFGIGVIALALSLHKERVAAPNQHSVLRAVRLHHGAQLLAVLLSLWVAVDAERESKRLREAQLDTAATAAAAKYAVPIMDLYFLNLLPAGSTLKNYGSLEAALSGTHLAGKADFIVERASPMFSQQRAAAVQAFNELQRIARTVLTDSTIYGQRYPSTCVKWAGRTLELNQGDLATLFVEGEPARAYAELVGQCVRFSTGAARDAVARQEN
jgi:hypothetical protein